jgi:hypothetical protein
MQCDEVDDELTALRTLAASAVAFLNKAQDYERPTAKALRFEYLAVCRDVEAWEKLSAPKTCSRCAEW